MKDDESFFRTIPPGSVETIGRSAPDQNTGHDTMRLLTGATRHNGASLVVVTHDPQVARWCDRVVEVDGRGRQRTRWATARSG